MKSRTVNAPLLDEPTGPLHTQRAQRAQPSGSFRTLLRGPLTFGVAIIAVWELAVYSGVVSARALPAPHSILSAWISLAGKSFFWRETGATLSAALLGLLAGILIGLFLGVLMASIPIVRAALLPLVVAYQNMPTVALAPVVLAWLGLGLESKVVLAAGISFFPIVLNTISAADSTDGDSASLFRSLGASRRQTLVLLTIPSGTPVVLAGLRIAAGQSMIGVIVAEFISGDTGLGSLIVQYTEQIAVSEVFALVTTLGFAGYFVYQGVLWVEKRLLHWARGGEPMGAA